MPELQPHSAVPLGPTPATELVERLAERGVFSDLDRHFARTLARISSEPGEVILAAAFTSRAVRNGHVCVDLARLAGEVLLDATDRPILDVTLPALPEWLARLRSSSLVSDGNDVRPLVIDHEQRLYLHRYWTYQSELLAELRARSVGFLPLERARLASGISQLFPGSRADSDPDYLQRVAVLIALHKRLALISGGPGTGKTHTVTKILALLQDQALARGALPLRILLVAPTGKAAARLSEAINANLPLIANPALAALIPREASTIHRALGYNPRTPTRFRHDSKNPLACDVLLVDEASMVDLALLAKLVAAVPAGARLILLGDKDQLASIEAGAIFGDIYNPDADHGYSAEFTVRIRELSEPASTHDAPARHVATEPSEAGTAPPDNQPGTAIRDCVVHLSHSYRYPADSGIATLACAINRGDEEAALATLSTRDIRPKTQLSLGFDGTDDNTASADVVWINGSDPERAQVALRKRIERGFSSFCRQRDPARKLEELRKFRVLCAHRRGPFGVEQLNAWIERQLLARGLLAATGVWYDSRPILVTRNDYQLELFNGDVGVIVADDQGRPRAYFSRPDGQIKSFVPARLPAHESVFAMTVHKSQGSEFDSVLLVLPNEPSPILTRELLYTAVTRARRRVELCATKPVLRAAILARVERASGLRDALWALPRARRADGRASAQPHTPPR